ncbi:Fic family protein [Demequina pelophila]|uniref:Fic family protein n=1 Tax=Demequina pelophila TaxID=1638984 RepID=UPI000784EE24|nr:Fic family protein [Demequina pelophila]
MSGDAGSPGGWPAVGYEDVPWTLPPELEGRVAITDVVRLEARPYRAAIAPTIADLDPYRHLTAARADDVASAAAEISAFDRDVAHLPVPMPAVLLRTESASSSQIEHLTANARNLATAALGLRAGENAAAVADNAAAMRRAIDMAGPLNRDQILAIHATLLRRGDPEIAGRFRSGPVWIGRPDLSPHGADFIPPRWERIEGSIGDLVAFAARRDMNGLVQAALAHAQFETIHPFSDGNGRTGRAIVHSILHATGFARHTTVPVSSGLLGDTGGYVRALTSFREGDIDPIVATFAGAARRAVANGRQLAADTAAIHEEWQQVIRARRDSGAWRLADHLFAQPVVTSAYVEQFLGSSRQGAFNAIATLVTAGALHQGSADRRNQVWQARDVLDAMDAFAARAARRELR